MAKYIVKAGLDYVQGHLRTGDLVGTVELGDKELDELRKNPSLAKKYGLELVNLDYEVDDTGTVDSIQILQVNEDGSTTDVTKVPDVVTEEPDYECEGSESRNTPSGYVTAEGEQVWKIPFFAFEVEDAPEQGTDKWLEWRKQGITATEAATIMFPDKYGSPLKVYTDKLGLTESDQSDDSGFLKWGHIIEDDLVREFEKRHEDFSAVTQGRLYQRGWCKCSLDAQCLDNQGRPCIIECKSSQSSAKWHPYPDRYYAQVQWQMYVTGIRRAYIVALIAENGWDYREIEIKFDVKFVQRMLEKCRTVWDCIQIKTPPAELSHFAPDKEAISALARDVTELAPPITVSAEDVEKFRKLKSEYEIAEQKFKTYKNELMMRMSGTKGLRTPDGKSFAYWSERKGEWAVDAKKLADKFPEAYDQCSYLNKSSRFIVFRV